MPEPTLNELRYPLPLAEKLWLETLPTRPLCHYTSQRGLVGILNDRAMWATDANYLNDSQEVIYAVNLAQNFFRNRTDKNLRFVGSGNSGTRIPEILARSGAAGKTSSKFK